MAIHTRVTNRGGGSHSLMILVHVFYRINYTGYKPFVVLPVINGNKRKNVNGNWYYYEKITHARQVR